MDRNSYQQPGVPEGKLSEKIVHVSKIYDGMESDYWTYAPAQYDPSKPAAVMVWQDGGTHNRNGASRLDECDRQSHVSEETAGDRSYFHPAWRHLKSGRHSHIRIRVELLERNQTYLKDSMRSTEYDTVSDRYARFLRDEIIPEVATKYNLRKDSYSHAISG